ncbi:UPF0236 family protein, partial [Geobacillus sp. ZGt-1]
EKGILKECANLHVRKKLAKQDEEGILVELNSTVGTLED